MVKRLILVTVTVSLAGTACARASDPPHAGRAGGEEQTVRVYEAVVRRLLKDNPSEGRIFIWDRLDPGVADADRGFDLEGAGRLSEADQRALADALTDVGSVRFVSDPKAVTGPQGQLIKGSVLIRLGPIEGAGGQVKVPASSYQGVLAGSWQTFVVKKRGDGWVVTGTTGPVAIS